MGLLARQGAWGAGLLLGTAAMLHATAASSRQDPPAAAARLEGRVFERGTITALGGVHVVTADGRTTVTDGAGRFSLEVSAGLVVVSFTGSQHEPLRVVENLRSGERRRASYHLTRRPGGARYESTVLGEQPRHEGGRIAVTGEELRSAPGAMGDPFRIIGLLPGVGTPMPLLPTFVVRGASPGMSGFYLDGMRLPQMFHVMLGGGVVHPRVIDRLEFYPGGYDASLGRLASGVVDAETRPARADGQHGEVSLRLFDVSALAELSLPRGVRIVAGGQYGFPDWLLGLFSSGLGDVSVRYWDYFLRLDWRWLTVEGLGSFDAIRFRDFGPFGSGEPRQSFHRLQVRGRWTTGRVDVETAVVGGVTEANGLDGPGVRKLSLGLRASLRARLGRLRLHVGLDGELSRFTANNFVSESPSDHTPALDEYGDLMGDRDGVVAGAFAVGTLELVERLLVATVSARADVYHAAGVTLLGIDPRASLELRPRAWLRMRAGLGLYQQPPSFPVALSAIDTFALSLGLQRAWQGAVTIEADLPSSTTFSATGYYQRFANVTDFLEAWTWATCSGPSPGSLAGHAATLLRQRDGDGYGMELLLRRHRGRVTGWVAYTLSRSDRIFAACGLRPADFDQTHMLNLVAQVRLPWQIMLGARLYVATGRPVTLLADDPAATPRNNARLPDFVQVDVRLDREWIFRSWALSAFLEVLNLTYSESNYGVTYSGVASGHPVPTRLGFRWVLPTVGLRGRF